LKTFENEKAKFWKLRLAAVFLVCSILILSENFCQKGNKFYKFDRTANLNKTPNLKF